MKLRAVLDSSLSRALTLGHGPFLNEGIIPSLALAVISKSQIGGSPKCRLYSRLKCRPAQLNRAVEFYEEKALDALSGDTHARRRLGVCV